MTTDRYSRPTQYVVGYFDLLGQSNKLSPSATSSSTTLEESQTLNRDSQQAVDAVHQFRGMFQEIFEALNEQRKEDLASLANEDELIKKTVDYATKPTIEYWGMSDAFVAAIPISTEFTVLGAAAERHDVKILLRTAAVVWLHCMARGHPIRGGVELGRAERMEEGDIYGEALVQAYRLESKVAEWPRIMVGERLLRMLEDTKKCPFEHFTLPIEWADSCLSILKRETGNKLMVDVLRVWADDDRSGREMLENDLFSKAHGYVRNELRKLNYKQLKDEETRKLISRYEELLEYFDRYASNSK